MTLDELYNSRLSKIEYHASGSIWSLQLKFSDGRASPIFGTRSVIDQSITIDTQVDIGEIQLLTSKDMKYTNAVKFVERRHFDSTGQQPGRQIRAFEVAGADEQGDWVSHKL